MYLLKRGISDDQRSSHAVCKKVLREFEEAFRRAEPIIAGMKGYLSHSLSKCMEKTHKYLLLVEWETLEDHTKGFRGSPDYQEWKALLHRFIHHFPLWSILRIYQTQIA